MLSLSSKRGNWAFQDSLWVKFWELSQTIKRGYCFKNKELVYFGSSIEHWSKGGFRKLQATINHEAITGRKGSYFWNDSLVIFSID